MSEPGDGADEPAEDVDSDGDGDGAGAGAGQAPEPRGDRADQRHYPFGPEP